MNKKRVQSALEVELERQLTFVGPQDDHDYARHLTTMFEVEELEPEAFESEQNHEGLGPKDRNQPSRGKVAQKKRNRIVEEAEVALLSGAQITETDRNRRFLAKLGKTRINQPSEPDHDLIGKLPAQVTSLKQKERIRKRDRQIERTNKYKQLCAEPTESEKAESEVIIDKIADGLYEAARIRKIRKAEQSLKAAKARRAAEAEAKRIAWREYTSWRRSIVGQMVCEQNWANSY